MVIIQSVSGYFSKYKILTLCVGLVVLDVLISYLFATVFPDAPAQFVASDSRLFRFSAAVLVMPIIETYFLQKLTISWLSRKLKSEWLIVFLAALLFGMLHCYSVPHMAKAFLTGLMFAILYVTIQKKGKEPFWYVAASHATFNFIAFLS